MPPTPSTPRSVALAVHEASVMYVRHVVAYIRRQIAASVEHEPLYRECTDVSAVDARPGAVVLLVGDGFPRFTRQPGCRYVFVNFSLLRKLRWWRPIPRMARDWIRAKYDAFAAKADLYDMVLDLHPQQTRLLEREFGPRGLPVRYVLPAVAVATARRPGSLSLEERTWDVCFVGTESPRRTRIRALLERRGIRVSPSQGLDLEVAIRNSKVVLNVHFLPCDTLEAPRVVHALSAGACLVTEPCYGLGDLIPEHCYCSVTYGCLAERIERLLRDPFQVAQFGDRATHYMEMTYAARSAESWQAALGEALHL